MARPSIIHLSLSARPQGHFIQSSEVNEIMIIIRAFDWYKIRQGLQNSICTSSSFWWSRTKNSVLRKDRPKFLIDHATPLLDNSQESHKIMSYKLVKSFYSSSSELLIDFKMWMSGWSRMTVVGKTMHMLFWRPCLKYEKVHMVASTDVGQTIILPW